MFVFSVFISFIAFVGAIPPKDALKKSAITQWADCDTLLGEGAFGWVKLCNKKDAQASEIQNLDDAYLWERFYEGLFLGNAPEMHKELKKQNEDFIKQVNAGNIDKFAVKVIDNPLNGDSSDSKYLNRVNLFDNELRSIVTLMPKKHENVINFYAVTADEEYIYIFMEAFENVLDMSDFSTKALQGEADVLIPQILKAVLHVNKNGIMHRDIKPENFLVSKSSRRVTLIDFGIATPSARDTEQIGTPEYTAPEILGQKSGDYDAYDTKVDAWSVGILIYKIITGGTPFQPLTNTTAGDVVTIRYIRDPTRLPAYNEEWETGIGKKWFQSVKNLLNKNPRARWGVADALDLHLFCQIKEMYLEGRNNRLGRLVQAQMWDRLKNHGVKGFLRRRARPEALQDTMARVGIDVQHHTMSKTVTFIRKQVIESKKSKKSISDLQAEICIE